MLGYQVDKKCVFYICIMFHGKCIQYASMIICLDDDTQGVQAEGAAEKVVHH